jgi:hypothetical protein
MCSGQAAPNRRTAQHDPSEGRAWVGLCPSAVRLRGLVPAPCKGTECTQLTPEGLTTAHCTGRFAQLAKWARAWTPLPARRPPRPHAGPVGDQVAYSVTRAKATHLRREVQSLKAKFRAAHVSRRRKRRGRGSDGTTRGWVLCTVVMGPRRGIPPTCAGYGAPRAGSTTALTRCARWRWRGRPSPPARGPAAPRTRPRDRSWRRTPRPLRLASNAPPKQTRRGGLSSEAAPR